MVIWAKIIHKGLSLVNWNYLNASKLMVLDIGTVWLCAKKWLSLNIWVGWLDVLFYGLSTIFGSFNAKLNFKQFSIV